MATGTVSLARLEEEINQAQYRQAAESFCRLVAEEQQPLRQVVHTAIGAAAPFVQVPSHMMRQPNGEMRGVNYDHTILGWRGAIALMSRMSARRAVLPSVQAMWYVPQGLNIWEQIICEFPGHYARDAEKCNTKFPGPDAEVNRFDGPAWHPPKRSTSRTTTRFMVAPSRSGSIDSIGPSPRATATRATACFLAWLRILPTGMC